MTQKFCKLNPTLLENLGKEIGQKQFLEQIQAITYEGVWVTTRETIGTLRKEWFAIKPLSPGQYELICGKAKVEPYLLEPGYKPSQVLWTTSRKIYTNGDLDTIHWRRMGKSGQYSVVVTNQPQIQALSTPAPGKHWVVLNSLEPMLIHLFADSDTKALLENLK